MSWWVVAGAGVLVVAAARVEAIKTGLGVAAGTAGVFALLLAVVNVLCAYLRMPYVPGTSDAGASGEELEVRLAS